MVKALVITGYGINCEEETAAAFRLAGAEAQIVHINHLLSPDFPALSAFHIIAFPGGFSFGDDLGSGRVLATLIRNRKTVRGGTLISEIQEFISAGGYVIGICNGFQVLVKTGLLPNIGGNCEQEVTLTRNESGHFEDRWCSLVSNPESGSPFVRGIDAIDLPVRHGEGRLLPLNDGIAAAIEEQNLAVLRYVDADGKPTESYPANPNGTPGGITGLTDPGRRVFGLMPHPEAFLSRYQHPAWNGQSGGDEGAGFAFFRNIVTQIKAERSFS